MGQCITLGETSVCPGEVKDILEINDHDLGHHERIFGDRIWGVSGIARQFKGSRCLKVGLTFVCDDDVLSILATGCMNIHMSDTAGHHMYNVCDKELGDLFEGNPLTMHDGKILKAKYSSDF